MYFYKANKDDSHLARIHKFIYISLFCFLSLCIAKFLSKRRLGGVRFVLKVLLPFYALKIRRTRHWIYHNYKNKCSLKIEKMHFLKWSWL